MGSGAEMANLDLDIWHPRPLPTRDYVLLHVCGEVNKLDHVKSWHSSTIWANIIYVRFCFIYIASSHNHVLSIICKVDYAW